MKLFVNESVETSKWFCEDQTIFHMRPKNLTSNPKHTIY